ALPTEYGNQIAERNSALQRRLAQMAAARRHWQPGRFAAGAPSRRQARPKERLCNSRASAQTTCKARWNTGAALEVSAYEAAPSRAVITNHHRLGGRIHDDRQVPYVQDH